MNKERGKEMKNADKPAMPLQLQNGETSETITKLGNADGLTKREYFAGLAFQGIMSNQKLTVLSLSTMAVEAAATISVEAADALLKELSQ